MRGTSEPARLLTRSVRFTAAAAVALLCAATVASAAPLHDAPVMRIWDADDGLLQHSVKALAKTPDGYLWLGTEAGLYRFDGFTFVRYARFVEPNLPADRIRALVVAPRGVLWVATTAGVARLEAGRFTPVPLDWSDLDVRAMFLDESERPWAVSSDASLRRVSGPSHPAIDAFRAGDHPVVGLAFARDGSVWAPTNIEEVGVLRWSPGSGAVETVSGIPPITSHALALPDGSVLVGGTDGLFRSKQGLITTLSELDVTAFEAVMGGALVGLGDTLQRWSADDGLEFVSQLPSRARSILVGAGGEIWVGTDLHGLARLTPRHVRTLTVDGPEADQSISTVFRDSTGGTWAAAPCDGAARFVNGVLDHRLNAQDFDPNSCVWVFGESPPGTLLLGTYGGGTARFDLASKTMLDTLGPEQGLPNDVFAIAPAASGGTWIGGNTGLFLLREGRVERAAGTEQLRQVGHVRQEADGTLWVGTTDGLFRRRGEVLDRLDVGPGLPGARVRHTASDGRDGVLVATYGGGLFHLSGDTLRRLGPAEGFDEPYLSRIVPDRLGGIWISGNGGLLRLSQVRLWDLLDGRVASLEPIRFTVADGMPVAECNGGNESSGFLDPAGILYLPTMRGVAMVDTTAFRADRSGPPEVAVEELRSQFRRVELDEEPTLQPRERDIEVHYTAFHLEDPHLLRFRYRLNAGEWRNAGARRVASFAGFKPGNHLIEIQARVGDGVWSSTRSLGFRALPHWYEQAAVHAVGSFLALFLMFRVYKRLRGRELEVQKLVGQRTEELEEANAKLAELANQDALTGIASRRRFDDRLALFWRTAHRGDTPISLLMIDVDLFKALNDRWGHLVGDRCLVEIASRLSGGSLRDVDLVARFGGEEFAVLLPETDEAGAQMVAERLHDAVRARPFPIGGDATVPVTVGVGVATLRPRTGGLPEDLVERADRALYRAKAGGRDRVET